jgi:hypothetical protein
MRKQQLRHLALNYNSGGSLPVGIVLRELVLWDFSEEDEIIRHNAEQLAKAILMSYHLDNFGASSFGLEEE